MTLYQPTSVTWPEPFESTWQLLGGTCTHDLAPKLPHLGLTDILFMTTLMSLPREQRPWGIATWMSDVFLLSRTALYELTKRVQQRLSPTTDPLSLPGKMAIRPLRQTLNEAFGQTRSIGWISQLLTAAGDKAGRILDHIDTNPLGTVIAARDETFFQGSPLLLVIAPVSTVILFAQATDDRKADTWGAALLIAQEQGVTIGGLVEDMARMYGKSQAEAELDVPVQKDVWHLERDGSQVLRDLERAAFRVDALELVDWRSGEIRDWAINEWLLEEALTAMTTIDHPNVQRWSRHQSQLLTGLDWLTASLPPYREQLAQVVLDDQQESFMRIVARHWRVQQALINGHRSFRQQAQEAAPAFASLVTNDSQRQQMAAKLLDLLNAACRTSSMMEGVNGLLKQFLHNHQAFRSPETLQLYLNLFVLWHNMRVFERGKRQGKTPYQLAGIDPGADDWLTLLGYPVE